MNASEVLVIILSIVLTIFLVVAIVLAVLLIKVTLQIRRVTSTAQKTVENLEAVAGNVSKASSQAFIGRVLLKQLRKLTKK